MNLMGSASPIGEAVRRRSAVLMGMAVSSGRTRRAWMTDESIRSFQTAFWANKATGRNMRIMERIWKRISLKNQAPFKPVDSMSVGKRCSKDTGSIQDVGIKVLAIDKGGKVAGIM